MALKAIGTAGASCTWFHACTLLVKERSQADFASWLYAPWSSHPATPNAWRVSGYNRTAIFIVLPLVQRRAQYGNSEQQSAVVYA